MEKGSKYLAPHKILLNPPLTLNILYTLKTLNSLYTFYSLSTSS
jgi:hypothetical protein